MHNFHRVWVVEGHVELHTEAEGLVEGLHIEGHVKLDTEGLHIEEHVKPVEMCDVL